MLPDDELERLARVRRHLPGRGRAIRACSPGILERDLLLRGAVRARPVREPAARRALPGGGDARAEPRGGRREPGGRAGELRGSLHAARAASIARARAHEVAVQESINTRHGVERIVRYAFELAASPAAPAASSRSCTRPTCSRSRAICTSGWSTRSRPSSPTSRPTTSTSTPRASTSWTGPARFDVIVTDNMFGDIITDLGAMIQGGMGIAAGGNINPDGREHVRADRRHRARPHRARARSTRSRRSARWRCCCASSASTAAAARVDRGIRAATRQMKSHARRRDGLHARPRSATSSWRERSA